MTSFAIPTRPIRDETDYNAALERINALFTCEEGTPEDDELAILVELVAGYDAKRDRLAPPTLRAMLRHLLEVSGVKSRDDLIALFGSPERADAVLAGADDLTAAEARRLKADWGIPFEVSLAAPATNINRR